MSRIRKLMEFTDAPSLMLCADRVPAPSSVMNSRRFIRSPRRRGRAALASPFLLRRFLAGAWGGRRERFAPPLGIHRALDTRAFLLEQHHRTRIAAAPPTPESFRHLAQRANAQPHRPASLAAQRL